MEKEIRFIICQTKRRTGRVNLSKLCHPPSERKCLLFLKERSGIQFENIRNPESVLALLLQVSGTSSLMLCVLADRFTFLRVRES
jgi:hypothetical protein